MQLQADTAALFEELSEGILRIRATGDTNMPASFEHLAGGYDAQYYGYLVCMCAHSLCPLQADTAAVFSQLSQKLLGILPTANTNMPASFGHLGGGYDAQYYGYMVSLLFHFPNSSSMNPWGLNFLNYLY